MIPSKLKCAGLSLINSILQIYRKTFPEQANGPARALTMTYTSADDDFEELLVMVEREEADRNRDLGLDVMDVVRTWLPFRWYATFCN